MTTNDLTLLHEQAHSGKTKTNKRYSPLKTGNKATGVHVLIALVILLSLFSITHLLKFPGSVGCLREITNGQNSFDLQASFSSTETYQRLEAFGEKGRQVYMQTMLTVDIIFPLSMFVFLLLMSKYTSQRWGMKPGVARLLSSLAIGYVVLDFLENLTIFFLLSNFPDRLEFLGSYIGYLTLGKRISMAGAIIIPIVLLAAGKISGRLRKTKTAIS